MVQSQTFIEDQKLQKQATVGILPIHLKSHTGKEQDFSKIFFWCLGAWFLPCFTRTIGHVLLQILEKSLKIYFLV